MILNYFLRMYGNVILVSIMLLSALSVQGMETQPSPTASAYVKTTSDMMAGRLEEFNAAYLLTRLPKESSLIQKQSLENSIKILMKLRMLSKDFNQLWTVEKMGDLCKNYSDDDKARMVGWLIGMGPTGDSKFVPLSILICTGFDKWPNDEERYVNDDILKAVVHKASIQDANFIQLVQLLFKHKANPNTTTSDHYPVFFDAQTIEVAQLFIDNGVNLHAVRSDRFKTNVLWHMLETGDCYSPDLLKFYLDHHIDTKNLNHRKECLLHGLVDSLYTIKDVDEYLKKAELLLDAIPDMIHTKSQSFCTPNTPIKFLMECAERKGQLQLLALFQKTAASLTLQAEEYNAYTCLLTTLPKEIVAEILPHCLTDGEDRVQSLAKSIKTFMKLSSTCKTLNRLLSCEEIGRLCKKYTLEEKTKVLNDLGISKYSLLLTSPKRLPGLIVVCAGADIHTGFSHHGNLFEVAISQNDMQCAELLFKHGGNPNVDTGIMPVFFRAETVKMAQLCLDNGADLSLTGYLGINVLWEVVRHACASDLMEFYLAKGAAATVRHNNNQSCVLHELAQTNYRGYPDKVDDFVRNGTLLINAVPGMLNAVNKYNQTPLDKAQETLQSAQRCNFTSAILGSEKMIALFRKHGALTGQEIAEQKKVAELREHSVLIAQAIAHQRELANKNKIKEDKKQNCIIS